MENETNTASKESPKSFEEIVESKELLAKLAKLGFTTPTEVQAQAVPVALAGGDAIIQAQTGSGKTLAFLLPLCQKLIDKSLSSSKDSTVSLFIAPTRELAIQIEQVIQDLDIGIAPNVLIGGVDMAKQKKTLANDRRIIVGTPGRILDFLKQRLIKLNECRYFVLDEADEMLSMGFIEDMRAILSRLPSERQGLFVSATISGRVEMLAHSFLTKPKRISTVDGDEDEPDIEHQYVEVASDIMAKPRALCDIIEVYRPRSAIIFCNTKSDTRLVEVLLRRRGFDARRINSDLSQAQRNKIMTLIRAEDLQFLIGTDIAARGIDIAQIDLVVNFNIHDQTETYVHRTGRTGRAGRKGRAISLVGPRDHGAFHHLKKVLDIEFEKIDLPSDEEVAGAKLVHLYEMIRNAKVELGERDTIVAKKLLTDLGEITDPSDELLEFIAKLCSYTSERFVAAEAKSLDEEIADEDASAKAKDSSKSRDGKSKTKRERKSDKKSDDSERPSRESKSKKSDEKEKSEDKPAEKAEPDEIRIYIGQGTSTGLTEEVFKEIVTNNSKVDLKELSKLHLREHYGFVDVKEPQATELLKALGNAEHKAEPLSLERAALLNEKRPPRRPQRRNGKGRGQNSRGGSRGGNNRRSQNNRRRD